MSYNFTTLAQDTFHRANENPLSDGGNWTTIIGDSAAQVVSDACEATAPSAFCGAVFSGISAPDNMYSSIKIGAQDVASNSAWEIYVRFVNNGNFTAGYSAYISNASPNSVQITAYATATTLATVSCTIHVGDVFLFGLYGSTWLLYQNGVLLAFGSDSSTPSGGTWGFDIISISTIASTTISQWAGGLISIGGGEGGIGGGLSLSMDASLRSGLRH